MCFSRALGTSETFKLVFSIILFLLRCHALPSTLLNWDPRKAVTEQPVSHLPDVLLWVGGFFTGKCKNAEATVISFCTGRDSKSAPVQG